VILIREVFVPNGDSPKKRVNLTCADKVTVNYFSIFIIRDISSSRSLAEI
jgi:hypothetical protein